MNVEGVFLARIQTFEVGDNLHRVAFLREAHRAMAFVARGRVQHRDGLFNSGPGFAVGFVAVFGGAQRTG